MATQGSATQGSASPTRAPAGHDFYKYGLKPVVGGGKMDATLKRLGTVQIKAMEQSNFVKPQSVMYELDGMCLITSHAMVNASYMCALQPVSCCACLLLTVICRSKHVLHHIAASILLSHCDWHFVVQAHLKLSGIHMLITIYLHGHMVYDQHAGL